jgi:hypothetical protein
MNKQLREDFARDGAALARELMGSQRVAASIRLLIKQTV